MPMRIRDKVATWQGVAPCGVLAAKVVKVGCTNDNPLKLLTLTVATPTIGRL